MSVNGGGGDEALLTTLNLFAVLEATDVDNLLEQFEAADPSCVDGPEDPKRKSQIMSAVRNHFSGTSHRAFPQGKVPRIGERTAVPSAVVLQSINDTHSSSVSVSSKRIKDALPREIIEKIKASSQKSKTIAIIEPVQKKNNKGQQNSGGGVSGGLASRFHQAGTSISRSKLRQFGINSPTPQQVQINLDHDYCNVNKSRRGRNSGGGGGNQSMRVAVANSTGDWRSKQQQYLAAQQQTRTVIRVSSTPVNANRWRSPQHAVALANAPLAAAMLADSTKPDPDAPLLKRVDDDDGDSSNHSSSSAAVAVRRDSADVKKDSGLESGEMSDDSSGLTNEEDGKMYTKLPSYLTSLPASTTVTPTMVAAAPPSSRPRDDAASAHSAVDEEEDRTYDRIPPYVKGISRSGSGQSVVELVAAAVAATGDKGGGGNTSEKTETKCDTKDKSAPLPQRRSLRRRQSSGGSSSSSSSSSDSSSSSSSSSEGEEGNAAPAAASSSPKKRVSRFVSSRQQTRSGSGKKAVAVPVVVSAAASSKRKRSISPPNLRRSGRRRSRSSSSSQSSRSRSPRKRSRHRYIYFAVVHSFSDVVLT